MKHGAAKMEPKASLMVQIRVCCADREAERQTEREGERERRDTSKALAGLIVSGWGLGEGPDYNTKRALRFYSISLLVL